DFMASLRFDNVKMLAEQRKKLSRMLKAAMPKVTQRAIAKTLGVGQMTVQRDLESNDSKHDDDTRGEARDLESNVTNLDLSGAEVAARARADAEYEWKFESRQKEIARRDREASARLNAEGRGRRVLFSPDQKQLALVIGPNEAGSRASVWWQEYQSSNGSYQKAQRLAATLEEQARRLFKQAEQVREDARETARQAFVAEHGYPITHASYFVIPNPGKSALPSSEKECIDFLLQQIDSGRIKSSATGGCSTQTVSD